MLFKCVLFCCLIVKCYAAVAGDVCTSKEGQTGICVVLSRCFSAIRLIKIKKTPQICGFEGSDPIVCCTDQEVPAGASIQPSVATTTMRLPATFTPEPELPEIDYVEINEIPTGCAPIPADMTSTRTGQKAFDKCLEYQEQFVYPCEKGVTLTADMHRANRCHHDPEELFNGAKIIVPNELPHLVLLGYENKDAPQWLCMGTIISENYILTAAHCLSARELGNVTYVAVGISSINDTQKTENIYKVKKLIPHRNYMADTRFHDIALLELEKPIQLSQFVMPACLDVGGPVNDSSVLAVTRGYNIILGQHSEFIKKVIIEKFAPQTCAVSYPDARGMPSGFDPQTQTCYAARTSGEDTCQGDSGGAILINSKSVNCMFIATGVTSFGKGCGLVSQPSIYTRVVTYMPWIESVVWP